MEEFVKLLPEGVTKEYAIFVLVTGLLFQIIWLVLAYHMQATLRLVRKENRLLLPGQSWFLAVPLINIFYNFLVVRRFTDSLNNEFHDKKIAVDENPTLKQGYFVAYAYLIANFPLPAFIGYLVIIICLLCYLNYIVKINEHKKLLKLETYDSGQDLESSDNG